MTDGVAVRRSSSLPGTVPLSAERSSSPEGHGFHNEENQFDFYPAMEAFFASHLKPPSALTPSGSRKRRSSGRRRFNAQLHRCAARR